MIMARLWVFFNCLLLTHTVYGSTEVKPPSGPFVSMLRTTFSVSQSITNSSTPVIKATLETEGKKYNFAVPDLGRYSEKSNNTFPDIYQDMNTSARIKKSSLNNSQKIKKNRYSNTFDSLPIEKQPQENPFGSKLNVTSAAKSPTSNQSFDNLPIVRPQYVESGFYPPEWALPNPLKPPNRAPQNESNRNIFNPNSMRSMPFSNQMPPWNAGNQTINGYR